MVKTKVNLYDVDHSFNNNDDDDDNDKTYSCAKIYAPFSTKLEHM